MSRLILASVLPLLLVPLTCASAATIHVPGDQPTIQAGIDAASYGDTVLVACGTYYEHDVVMKSGICLMSETGLADCVMIDAQQVSRVMYCENLDETTIIEGFTLANGEQEALSQGAGIGCFYSSPSLVRCTFLGNAGTLGGGMYCVYSSPTLADCTFLDNEANSWGGGMYCVHSSPTLTNCTFSENAAVAGYAFVGQGGGMFCSGSSPTLTNCTFSENVAPHAVWDGLGGGMRCVSSSPTLTNTIIAFSTEGEAISCDGASSPSLICCDIFGNAGGDWIGCIADQYGVNSNFSDDPLFCLEDNPGEPYSLHEGSPCLPENSPCGELVGALGQGCGAVTVVEAVSWGAIKAMYR